MPCGWDEEERKRDLLWRGDQLGESRAWMNQAQPSLTAVEEQVALLRCTPNDALGSTLDGTRLHRCPSPSPCTSVLPPVKGARLTAPALPPWTRAARAGDAKSWATGRRCLRRAQDSGGCSRELALPSRVHRLRHRASGPQHDTRVGKRARRTEAAVGAGTGQHLERAKPPSLPSPLQTSLEAKGSDHHARRDGPSERERVNHVQFLSQGGSVNRPS